jgi:hypothetical protein
MEKRGAIDLDEVHVLDAFRDALGRMFTRGGEKWLDTIPKDAYLTLGDVRRMLEGDPVRVLEPQRYTEVVSLTSHHMMIEEGKESGSPYGYFYGQDGESFVDSIVSLDEKYDDHFAVSGSGADYWYKITDSLKKHALNWE